MSARCAIALHGRGLERLPRVNQKIKTDVIERCESGYARNLWGDSRTLTIPLDMPDAEGFSVRWLRLGLCLLVGVAVLAISIAPLAQGKGPYSTVNGPIRDGSDEKAAFTMNVLSWAVSVVASISIPPILFVQFLLTCQLIEMLSGTSDLLALMCTRSC